MTPRTHRIIERSFLTGPHSPIRVPPRARAAHWLARLAAGVGLAAALAAGPARGQTADTTRFMLESGVARFDRYALEVRFPGATGSPIVVDASVDPRLGAIDPASVPGRLLKVFRDGRVEWGGPTVAARRAGMEAARRLTPRPLGPRLDGARAGLTPALERVPFVFPSYYDGTLAPSWKDYDGDGDLDLPLFRNEGDETFTEIPGFRTLLAGGNYHGSSWCDYDRDGDPDLVIMGYNLTLATNHRTLVLRNDGGTFVDVAAALGMNVKGRGETAVWGDFDGDGDPDLFAPYHDHMIEGLPDSSLYYRNEGNGLFTERSFEAGIGMTAAEPPLKPEGADAVDWDGDGDLDLYAASHLFLNEGATFVDVRAAVGLPAHFDEGSCFVDYDNDGDFDLYTKNDDTAHLYRNRNGAFTDVTVASGLVTPSYIWGDSWADVDNDGDLDVLQFLREQPARLMVNQGDGTFVADPAFTALNLRGGMSSWGDFDADGDVDVVEGTGDSPYALYANRLERQIGAETSFLRVRVLDELGRETQHRATVTLRPLGGPVGRVLARAVGAGATYCAQNEYDVHFGLGIPGLVGRSPDLPSYAEGTEVVLEATPAPSYRFVEWTGDLSSSQNPLPVTMSANLRVMARFELETHPLTTPSSVGGSIERSPAQASYALGSRVTLTAVPDAGHAFLAWSGDLAGSQNPATLLIDGPKTVTASYSILSYPLTLTALGPGTIVKSPDQASYTHGSVVEVTPVPAIGHHFTRWGGDASGAETPGSITLDGPKLVTALFEINTYPLQIALLGEGTVLRDPDQQSYPHASWVRLTAVASDGYRFAGWSGDATGNTNPVVVVMDRARQVTALFQPIARRYWWGASGGGDGVSWADDANWSNGVRPGPAEEVVLDHSRVAGDYTVVLPNGTLGVDIARLAILPGPGLTIDLVLPSQNRARPGFRVGDGALGVPDIRLGAGATLRNESGAGAGHGIVLASGTADSIAIENGARYVHAATLNPGTLPAQIATSPGTERGEFHYRLAGNAAFGVAAAGISYGTLVLERITGVGAFTIAGAAPLTIRGDLVLLPGTSLVSSMEGDLVLNGSLTNEGLGVSLPATQNVRFVGAVTHRLSGAGTVQIAGSSSVAASCTLAVASDAFGNNGTMQIDGMLRIEGTLPPGGTGTYRYGSEGRLAFAHAAGSFPVGAHAYWPTVEGPRHVEVLAADGITMNVSRTIGGELRTHGPIAGADRLTLAGAVRLGPGGSLAPAPLYGEAAILVYERGGLTGAEWVGAPAGAGVPGAIVIDAGPDTLHCGPGRVAAGPLRVASGTLALTGTLEARGDLVVDGALRAHGATLRLAGDAEQVVGGSGPLALATLAIAKSAGAVRLARDVACAGDATRSALAFEGTSDRLVLAGHRLTLEGAIGVANAAGVVEGDSAAGILLRGAGDHGTLRFAAGAARLGEFEIDAPDGGRVAIPGGLEVGGSLALTRGLIETVAPLVLAPGATVTRVDAHVAGPLRRTVLPGVPAAFDVGTAQRYVPVTLTLDDAPAPLVIEASSHAEDHPEIASGPFVGGRVRHHWRLVNPAGGDVGSHRVAFEFGAAARDSGVDPARMAARRWSGGWSYLETTARGATGLEARGTALGAYAIGEVAWWTLTDAVSGSGSIRRAPELDVFENESTVILTARPEPGYAFAGWSGDAAGGDTTVAVVMSGDRGVAASFVDAPPVARVLRPNGGEVVGVGGLLLISWNASDPLGVERVDLLLSRSGHAGPFDTLAAAVPNTGAWEWRVGGAVTEEAVVRVVVRDSAGLAAHDQSDAPFVITTQLASPVAAAPRDLELAPIAPNPMRGRARIAYAVPRAADVRLDVVDVQGREVAVVARGPHAPGRYEVVWRAGARSPAPGVYFVRLRVAGAERVRRLVFTR